MKHLCGAFLVPPSPCSPQVLPPLVACKTGKCLKVLLACSVSNPDSKVQLSFGLLIDKNVAWENYEQMSLLIPSLSPALLENLPWRVEGLSQLLRLGLWPSSEESWSPSRTLEYQHRSQQGNLLHCCSFWLALLQRSSGEFFFFIIFKFLSTDLKPLLTNFKNSDS